MNAMRIEPHVQANDAIIRMCKMSIQLIGSCVFFNSTSKKYATVLIELHSAGIAEGLIPHLNDGTCPYRDNVALTARTIYLQVFEFLECHVECISMIVPKTEAPPKRGLWVRTLGCCLNASVVGCIHAADYCFFFVVASYGCYVDCSLSLLSRTCIPHIQNPKV